MEQSNSNHLTEREQMMDLLNSQKQLMSLYAQGISEASCPKLRNLLGGHFQNIANDQYQLWSFLNKKGYYPVEQAE